jgi:hypothetical protein
MTKILTWLVLDLTKLICLGRLLGGEETEPILDGDPLPTVLVLGGEPGGVRGEGGLALGVHLAEGVHPGVVTVEVVHQIHDGSFESVTKFSETLSTTAWTPPGLSGPPSRAHSQV